MTSTSFAVPFPLSLSTTGVSYTNPPGMAAHVDVGGIKFCLAVSDQYPYQRQVTPIAKDQVDNSANPGDNSLAGWWTRSQTDWSLGAGQTFMEPITSDGVDRGFDSSAGVDVFNRPGFVSCLPAASVEDSTATGSDPVIIAVPDGYVYALGSTVTRVIGGASASDTAAGAVTHLSVAGPNVLVCSNGVVEYAPLVGSFTLASAFTTGAATPRAWGVKSRILIAFGDELHEHAGTTISGSTDLTLATPWHSFDDSTHDTVSVAATPRSILLAANTSSGSFVYGVTLEDDGTLPTASVPVPVAEFPPNEAILAIGTYLGTFVGVATGLGFRVATATSDGGLSYGPLLDAPVASATGFTMSGYDRFLHYPTADAGDGRGGLVRVDLSELGSDGRCPWSLFDRVASLDTVTGGVVTSDREAVLVSTDGSTASLVVCVDGNGLDDGWLVTSLVRFGTLELKAFDTVRVDVDPAGILSVATVTSDGSTNNIGSTATQSSFSLRSGLRAAVSELGLRFTFTPSGSNGPVLRAWSVKAYPAIENRGQTIALPLMNFDREMDARGVPNGHEGRANERWLALCDRLSNGVPVVVDEAHSGWAYSAKVESCVFTMADEAERQVKGFGGIINLVVRTLL